MARIATRIAASCVLLTLLQFATSSPLFLKEGDACSDGGVAGTCLRVRHCQPALSAIQRRRPLPQRCGFIGPEEVFCCPQFKSDNADRDMLTSDLHTDEGLSGGNDTTTSAVPVDKRPSATACRSYKDERSGLEDKILPERTADQHEFPHIAALGYNVFSTEGDSWLCGGALISDQFVLTAAHCCASIASLTPVTVRLGVNNLTTPADIADYEISEIVLHPSYRRGQFHNDIALLKLDRKVDFSDAIFPACLSTEEGDPSFFTAVGWGATDPTGTRLSSVLMKTTIYPIAQSDCNNIYKRKFPNGVDSSLVCAGDPQGTTDTCRAYSGGPLVTGRAAPYTVVGITSVGPTPCGSTILYSRVSHYLDWIQKIVWPQRGSS